MFLNTSMVSSTLSSNCDDDRDGLDLTKEGVTERHSGAELSRYPFVWPFGNIR